MMSLFSEFPSVRSILLGGTRTGDVIAAIGGLIRLPAGFSGDVETTELTIGSCERASPVFDNVSEEI